MFQNFRKASARFGFCQRKPPLPRDPKVPPYYSAGLQIYRIDSGSHLRGSISFPDVGSVAPSNPHFVYAVAHAEGATTQMSALRLVGRYNVGLSAAGLAQG
jgi:hypothetical protein